MSSRTVSRNATHEQTNYTPPALQPLHSHDDAPGAELDDARAVLEALYPGAVPNCVLVLNHVRKGARGRARGRVRLIPMGAATWQADAARAAAALIAEQAADARDGRKPGALYYRVAARRSGIARGKHGGADDVRAVPALWVDLDFGTTGHAADGLPPDEDAVRRVLAAMGMPEPSLIVHSGNGLHLYWFLAEPLTGPAGRASVAARAFRAVADRLEAAGKATGYTVDVGPCHAAANLRLPGSTNYKAGERRPVRLLSCDPTRRYELAELLTPDELAEPEPKPKPEPREPRAPAERRAPTAGDSERYLPALALACDELRTMNKGERHAACLRVGFRLAGRDDIGTPPATVPDELIAACLDGGGDADDVRTLRDAWRAGLSTPYTPTAPTAWTPATADVWLGESLAAMRTTIARGRWSRVSEALAAIAQRATINGPRLYLGGDALSIDTGKPERTSSRALADVAELPTITRDASQARDRHGHYIGAPAWILEPPQSLANPHKSALTGEVAHGKTTTTELDIMPEATATAGLCATNPLNSIVTVAHVLATTPAKCAAAIHPRTAEPSTATLERIERSGEPPDVQSMIDAGDVGGAVLALGERGALVGLGGRADVLRAVNDGAHTLAEVMAATGRRDPCCTRAALRWLEGRGAITGADVATGRAGRPARVWDPTEQGREACTELAPCAALVERRRRESASRKDRWAAMLEDRGSTPLEGAKRTAPDRTPTVADRGEPIELTTPAPEAEPTPPAWAAAAVIVDDSAAALYAAEADQGAALWPIDLDTPAEPLAAIIAAAQALGGRVVERRALGVAI